METQVRTPQAVFMQPQRLVVPLFQRPYVWNEENQWEPLWNDVVRVAERVLSRPSEKHQPHFLGAVVLQQVAKQTGHMQERTIIDGQQRLTTLQLLLDALHAELLSIQAQGPAARLEPLVANGEPFWVKPEDRYKVWPTNRDRVAFNTVMAASPPIDYETLRAAGGRMLEAHRYFAEQAREWLARDGESDQQRRSEALETTVRERLQLVVIDLAADENAQEIFETLNARGAQLTAADLIKNFVFQRLLDRGVDVEAAYRDHWQEFETTFWEKEVSAGRFLYSRSSLFLNHWLVARTAEEVVAREVFDRFKRFADHDAGVPMPKLLVEVHQASKTYRALTEGWPGQDGQLDRVGLFLYRTTALESEVVKPLLLLFLDPREAKIPDDQLAKALDVIESWMVRRMLLRVSAKSYNQVLPELIAQIRRADRSSAGDVVERFLGGQTSTSRYWPDDGELREQLRALQIYRLVGRGRLRMVMEGIEDHRRGWRGSARGLGDQRVARGKLAIEHIMPRKWQTHWPLDQDPSSEGERERLIHTLGNLTLLTGQLNSKVSNGPWLGKGGKREGLEGHDVLLLNRELLRSAGDQWTEQAIRQRTQELIEAIIQIWPVPADHRSVVVGERTTRRKKPSLADLINGGALNPGMSLFPRRKVGGRIATLLADGRLDIDGTIFGTPSQAARHLVGHAVNGWHFFLTDQTLRRSLRAIRREYVNALDLDGDDELEDDGDELTVAD
jgi:hypothetical protein